MAEKIAIGTIHKVDKEPIFYEGDWIKTENGWEQDDSDFYIIDDVLSVIIDRGEYEIAKGDHLHLFAMGRKYLDKVSSQCGMDLVDVMPLPETDEIRKAIEGSYAWGDPVPFGAFLDQNKQS